ncbi:MAG TPA: helicase-related protein, partial [Chloroflexota bacterium]|nr:helicase-related protein [Chloroflexota bacterium]
VEGLLKEGFRPIVFCRYISTADYIAEELGKRLRGVEVRAVTGKLPPEERLNRVEELAQIEKRVLVATDCLAEGINLQKHFDAVLHYDLSWNPTRHEQREGRVDRYGQPSERVRTVMFYGANNEVDGAVLKVLLRKAETIRKQLGISVPVPMDSATVLEAIFDSLFHSRNSPQQLSLDLDMAEERLEREWQLVSEREKRTRTIFSQAAIKEEEVMAELEAISTALGTAEDVEFVLREACNRLGSPLVQRNAHWEVDPSRLPSAITDRVNLTADRSGKARIAFEASVPSNVTYVSRTHPFVEAVAGHLLETALEQPEKAVAKRAGAMRTDAVEERTVLLLLRARYLVEQSSGGSYHSMLAEECLLAGLRGPLDGPTWLEEAEAARLLAALPLSNLPPGQVSLWVGQVEDSLSGLLPHLEEQVTNRAESLLASHRRVRDAAGLRGVRYRVQPQLPVDLLGIYVLMPPPPGSQPSPPAGASQIGGRR